MEPTNFAWKRGYFLPIGIMSQRTSNVAQPPRDMFWDKPHFRVGITGSFSGSKTADHPLQLATRPYSED